VHGAAVADLDKKVPKESGVHADDWLQEQFDLDIAIFLESLASLLISKQTKPRISRIPRIRRIGFGWLSWRCNPSSVLSV
jgi:hypothetical protein